MEDTEKEQLVNRLNIVMQQRNNFLDQIVLMQETIDKLTQQLKDKEEAPVKPKSEKTR